MMRGYIKAARSRIALEVVGAYRTAEFLFRRMPGKANLPNLDRIIRKIIQAPAREQTPEEGLRVAEMLVAMYGGKDKRKKR